MLAAPRGPRQPPEFKAQVLAAYEDRRSLRGIQRVFGVCYQTMTARLGKKAEAPPAFEDTLLPTENSNVLKLDELRSFVGGKARQCWLWRSAGAPARSWPRAVLH